MDEIMNTTGPESAAENTVETTNTEPWNWSDTAPTQEQWERANADLVAEQDGRIESARSELSRTWGGDYDANIGYAGRYAESLGLSERFLENAVARGEITAEVIDKAAALGRQMIHGDRDTPIHDEPKRNVPGNTAAIEQRLDELHQLQYGDWREQDRYRSKAVQDEMHALYSRLHGNGPIVGRDLRNL